MSTRRTQPGGWVARRRGPCRRCGVDVPKGRFTFCSDVCVHEWKLRTDPAYLREQVFRRDHGICASCGLDTEAMRRNKRKLDYRARRQFERDWGRRRHFWDADHIVPVAEGGGECDLSNMRTLCLKCHREATAALLVRLRIQRTGGAASAPKPKVRSTPAPSRDQIFARDRGICAMCGIDTEALRKDKRKLDYRARRQFEKEWGGDDLWVAVADRTLCRKCHRQAVIAASNSEVEAAR